MFLDVRFVLMFFFVFQLFVFTVLVCCLYLASGVVKNSIMAAWQQVRAAVIGPLSPGHVVPRDSTVIVRL